MVNKIDSNFTGLRYTEETTIGVLPADPVWNQLQPNGYNDFGAQITTQARTPITSGRQRKKGVITDLDAVAGFGADFTQEDFYDLMQGFMFADWRPKASAAISAATGSTTDDYTVDDEEGFLSGHLVLVSDMATTANNGLKVLNGVTANALSCSTDLTTETSTGTAKVVGFQFPAGVLSVNQVSASETQLIISSLASASEVLTMTDIDDAPDETVTIGSTVYTFKSTLSTGPTVAYEVKIGTLGQTLDNLAHAINGTGTAGTNYSVGTLPHPDVTAESNGSSTVTVTAIVSGTPGNSIALDETLTDGSWAGAATTLSGGSGIGWINLGLIPGEWIHVGGDETLTEFDTAGNNGWVRGLAITSNSILTVDKTVGTKEDEVGGSKTIQVFFGDVIKNESDSDLIVRRSYQFERSLVSAGYEYIVGSVANTIAFAITTANKITCELGFISMDAEQVAVGERKDGTFPTAEISEAFNTSSDFARLRLANTSALGTPLFAFLTELNVSINNNVTPDKAVSVLGAFDVTTGDFVVEGNMTAYFADIEAVAAVRDNADITLDFIFTKSNAGWIFDIPLLTLGDGRLQVEKDQPIKIPLSIGAAEDPTFNHTLLVQSFTYLPNVAS